MTLKRLIVAITFVLSTFLMISIIISLFISLKLFQLAIILYLLIYLFMFTTAEILKWPEWKETPSDAFRKLGLKK